MIKRDERGVLYHADCGHAGAVIPAFTRGAYEAGAGTEYLECPECASRRAQSFEEGLGRRRIWRNDD